MSITTELFEIIKSSLLRKMFWGRGSWYRNVFHLTIICISSALLFTGVLGRNQSINANALSINYGSIGNNDLLAQGSSIAAVVAVDSGNTNYSVYKHKVQSGESLEEISSQYNVDVSTIIWANDDVINPFIPKAVPGTVLEIPEINGVLHTVQKGDTVESLAATNRGNIFDIIELNELPPPDYKLRVGRKIFIPNGEAPPSPLPGLRKDYFGNPLSHPACTGYAFQRGFTYYHSGIDLSKWDGCPIRSVAAGRVVFAGWYGSAGYSVIIEHGEPGNSIKSYYYHGNGEIWVKAGDYVEKGQDIMRMGTTGNSTGTHLHLSLRKNDVLINPGPLIPF